MRNRTDLYLDRDRTSDDDLPPGTRREVCCVMGRSLLETTGSYDPDTLQLLCRAFDEAWEEVANSYRHMRRGEAHASRADSSSSWPTTASGASITKPPSR